MATGTMMSEMNCEVEIMPNTTPRSSPRKNSMTNRETH